MLLGFLSWIVFQLFWIIFVWREYREEGKKVLRGGGGGLKFSVFWGDFEKSLSSSGRA